MIKHLKNTHLKTFKKSKINQYDIKNQKNNLHSSVYDNKSSYNVKDSQYLNLTKKEQIALQIDLQNWLLDIQQNSPLPYEITNIYFILDFSNNDIELTYSASDINLKIYDYGFYQPLEAEYFYSQILKQIAKKMQKKSKLFKQQIFNFLKQICFSVCNNLDFLKDKKIFFGQRFDSV